LFRQALLQKLAETTLIFDDEDFHGGEGSIEKWRGAPVRPAQRRLILIQARFSAY